LIWRNRDCDKASQIGAPLDLGVEIVPRVRTARARNDDV
jgi:hypothetical protein